MDMNEVLEHVPGDLRRRPGSHFFEVYFRIRERGASSADVHAVFYDILKRNEVVTTRDKWRLAASHRTTKNVLTARHCVGARGNGIKVRGSFAKT
jgi:hypothetical protein